MHTLDQEDHSSARHRKRRRGSQSKRGRLLLVAIFVALRISDAVILFGAGPYGGSEVLSSVITTGIWTTALLVAIGYRQNWARYILVGLLFLGVLGFLIVAPMIAKDEVKSPTMVTVLCITTIINAGAAWCLISSSSIRRLLKIKSEVS